MNPPIVVAPLPSAASTDAPYCTYGNPRMHAACASGRETPVTLGHVATLGWTVIQIESVERNRALAHSHHEGSETEEHARHQYPRVTAEIGKDAQTDT